MRHTAPSRKPSFLWQAVLILLPVALMAGFGFWAILRERNAVEQEARQRAAEIIETLPGDFGQRAAGRLTRYLIFNTWLYDQQRGPSAWPESESHKRWLADTNDAQILRTFMADLHAVYPEWPAGPVTPVSFSLDASNNLPFEGTSPPHPPAWLLDMPPEQYQTWVGLQTAACASGSTSNLARLLNEFARTQPSPSARACAEFIQLRSGLAGLAATNALVELLHFAENHHGVVSDSGLPLRTLALAEALQTAQKCGPTAGLWDALQTEVSSPSQLAPGLLNETGNLVARDAPLSEAVRTMRLVLTNRQAQADLAEAVKQNGKVNTGTATNLWVEARGQRWFCISSGTGFDCYPEPLVARGFANAFSEAQMALPRYFGIALELEGQPVPLPAPWSRPGGGQPVGDLLAAPQFEMSEHDAKWGGDALPGHPRFTVQIRLTNRTLLYARQRQLQCIFGTLIGVSATAALIGFLAAYRAFRRQQELSELKSNFVSSVSHELRAPIASVRLMAENLEGGKIPGADKQQEYFRFIVQECRRLSSLIENVLDFSRIEQGRKQYELEPTDLTTLTQTTVRLMEPYAREKGVQLRLETSPGDGAANIELIVDGRAIQQALVNLLDNAIKHSAKGQTVAIGIDLKNTPPATIARLWVADQGPGIPLAEQEKIFERFYRRGSELRRETQGIGIGLSLVKHIVAAHGGRVLVASKPGEGSRFTIELPVKEKSESAC